MTAQPYNRFVFVSWSWHLSCNGNQALEAAWVTLGKSLITSKDLSPTVHKEIVDGHIFTMQYRLFQKLFV